MGSERDADRWELQVTRAQLKNIAERIRDLYRGSTEALEDIALEEMITAHRAAFAEAREACAKACEARAAVFAGLTHERARERQAEAGECADLIRALPLVTP